MIEQCPCVKPPGSNECLSYDNRLQAANIDEALHTFPDLSSMMEPAQPLVSDESVMKMKYAPESLLSQQMAVNGIFVCILKHTGRENERNMIHLIRT